MKKLFGLFFTLILVGCANPAAKVETAAQAPAQEKQQVALTPPAKTEIGFVQLANSPYYVDTASIWVNNEKKHLINFDTLLNLKEGHYDFKDSQLVTHSIRQHKVLDCKAGKLTHLNAHLYSEFWGKGEAVEAQHQSQYTLTLKAQSTLGIIGKIMCANYYRK